MTARCGFADVALRRTYAEAELCDGAGRCGRVARPAWLMWQGDLLDPGLRGRAGPWPYADLGVLMALVLGFVVLLVLTAATVRKQQATT